MLQWPYVSNKKYFKLRRHKLNYLVEETLQAFLFSSTIGVCETKTHTNSHSMVQ